MVNTTFLVEITETFTPPADFGQSRNCHKYEM